ncbi:hypothetical protein MWU54_06195 [Marivita sp. S6314]|uniref:hypothetical protein n=1 Tax=Marivita sp. S6314 TaxID=2926406 RepID=UPI001FF6C475|nr:hypothetical protein [Marivita sp. S6314]MCK0149604.1 hypothetical protein [Marivita sp. S6314]
MERTDTIEAQASSLRSLLAKQVGARRGTLAKRVAKAGRMLPVAVRNDIAAVAEAEQMSRHPKVGRRLDPKTTHAAYERAATFLRAIDVRDRRKGLVLSILGSMAFNILAVVTLLIIVLRWRGLV